ncbi:MAG: aminotransferase class I/II-fold pyridoxal phosphate-dependent enzyme [Polyangiaceae bacterium]|nr:aminotransferase class I/II-fold pyridoxal phosphate-dependent enzyme [Polyangiaceae bacterium]
MSWLHDQTTEMLRRIEEAKAKKAFPFFRPFENVGPRVKVGAGSYVNFTSNDYLGLSQHPKLIAAAIAGTRRYGTGLGSARPQATSVRHLLLEERLAKWTHYQGCAVFTTGYQALVGVLQTFLDDECTVVLDKLSHASIIDGVLMAQGKSPELEVRFCKHNNVKHLDSILASASHPKKMVVIEGLYSVDGDLAPLADMVAVAKKHGAVVVLDDAHGLGALGPTGLGVCELSGLVGEIDLLIGTFSKSFGTVGGFVCADQTLIDYLKLTARSFLFSATLPLAQCEAALAALDIISTDHSLFRKLEDNARFFRGGLEELGFDLGESTTHISPIFVKDEMKTLMFGAYLFHAAEVIMMPFVSPGVAPGTERLRCNVTAAHTKDEMGYTLEALAMIGKMLGVLPESAKTSASNARRIGYLIKNKAAGLLKNGLPFVRHEIDTVREIRKQLKEPPAG